MTHYDEFPFGPDLNINELLDESNACRHGSLPFDGDVACDCWNVSWTPGKWSAVLRLPVRGCECGCGEVPSRGRRFVQGHNMRAHMRWAA